MSGTYPVRLVAFRAHRVASKVGATASCVPVAPRVYGVTTIGKGCPAAALKLRAEGIAYGSTSSWVIDSTLLLYQL